MATRGIGPEEKVHRFVAAAGKNLLLHGASGSPGDHMIGEMIGELTGKTIGQRLVHHWGGRMKLERTIEAKGKVLGTEVSFIATTWSVERPQGGMFVKGHGVMMTRNGEKAEAQGSGISFPSKGGGWSVRGVRYFQTGSAALKKLNDVAVVFEIEVGADGTYHDKMWEWK
jgi:hypothetical protein